MQLLFWDDKAGNWSNVGVFRNDTAILASGDNCTFVGYTTHFTTFTLGGLTIRLNAIDPTKVWRLLAPTIHLHATHWGTAETAHRALVCTSIRTPRGCATLRPREAGKPPLRL